MEEINKNKEVLSFMVYMWNKWSFDECMTIFNGNPDNPYDIAHYIWNKYLDVVDKYGVTCSPSILVADLDEDNLNLIIKRACSFYYGRSNKK